MKEYRKVIAGSDPLDALEIDDSFYRARVEYELRAKLLRLRQKAAGMLHDRQLLVRLMTDSFSTFNVLIRHALLLSGFASRSKPAEVLDEAERKFGSDVKPLVAILAIREGKTRGSEYDAVALLEGYMREIERVIQQVDKLAK
jgi:hypothetical protein